MLDGARGPAAVLVVLGLLFLGAAAAAAVVGLLPKERRVLGLVYLERLTRWPQVMRSPGEIQGEFAVTLFETIAVERSSNRRKTLAVRTAFALLLLGLALVAAGISILIVTA